MSAAWCTLQAPGMRAAFVPELGMVGCSLEHEGAELLVLGDGLEAYRDRGATMGIPLLHPWANRLARPLPASEIVHRDRNGLPMHGVLPRVLPFTVVEETESSVRAEFDTHDHPAVLEVFPHPHSLTVVATLSADGIEIRTTLRAYGKRPVPVTFGYHPYLHLPGMPRAEWTIDIPARTRLALDERMLPTGLREPVRIERAALGGRSFDDAYADLAAHPRFTVEGGGRTLGVEFLEGYPYAQVYAPADRALVCFEPMTAPTNALASGDGLTMVRPGETYHGRVPHHRCINGAWPRLFMQSQVADRELDRLRERRVGLDRVEHDVDRHLGADRQRQLAQPLPRLGADGHRADEHAPHGVGEHLQEARPLRPLVGREPGDRPRARP